jgi:hypothetical protein
MYEKSHKTFFFITKQSRLEDHLKTGPEIGWLKAIKNQTQIYPEIE